MMMRLFAAESKRPCRYEESKVKLKHRVSLLSDLKKRGASRVAHFLQSVFKEQAPPQSGEGSLLRCFWSFTGASRAVAARTGAAIVVVPQPVASSTGCSISSMRDKSKVPAGQQTCALTPRQLAAVQFPHNLLDRPACRQAPLKRLLQALLV